MKRLFSFMLVAVLLLACMPLSALAANDNGVCGPDSTWTFDGTTLTVSGTGVIEDTLNGKNTDAWKDIDDKVKRVVINEGITEIEQYGFLNFYALEEIVLPEGLEKIGGQCFQSCDMMKEINLPKSLTYIDTVNAVASVFSGERLERINVHPENLNYASIDGILFDKEIKTLYCYPMGKTDESYVVPDSVETIAYSALHYIKAKTVSLPHGLKLIDEYAFFRGKVENISIPETVNTIGQDAFQNCDGIKNMVIPESVKVIGDAAFLFCDNLEYLEIHNPDCRIIQDKTVVPTETEIHGYSGSTAEKHAKKYGHVFVNLETGESTDYYKGNAGMLAMLPDEPTSYNPANCQVYSVDEYGEKSGYQCTMLKFHDTTNPFYQEIYAHVTALTKDCKNDYDRAKAINKWVSSNMTYVYAMFSGAYTEGNVYVVWRNMAGNCECYTLLTNAMLSMANIPTASVVSPGHIFTAAYVDGEWIIIDSTNGAFDISPEWCDEITQIVFSANEDLICIIEDYADVKLAMYGESYNKKDEVFVITIPEYVTDIAYNVIPYESKAKDLVIKGVKGSYAEEYIRKNHPAYNSIVYDGDMFIATVDPLKPEEPSDPEVPSIPEVPTTPEVDNTPDNTPNGEPLKPVRGDINGNGKLDMTDYILLKRNYFGTYDFTADQFKRGDINKNEKIDMTDYILLKRAYFGTYTIK